MTDLERYEMAGALLLCRTCGKEGNRYRVYDFGRYTMTLMDIHVEAGLHESAHHEPVFENNATENCAAALRSSQALARLAEAADRDVRTDQYYACYPRATAYRDGMVNGMGGNAGDLAGLLGPETARALAESLEYVSKMGRDYEELVQDHNRNTCADFLCGTWGHLVDIAHAVDRQLPGQK
jgi:hypothetical protein